MSQDVTSRFLSRIKDKREHAKSEPETLVKIIGKNGKVKETVPHVRDLSENGMRFRALHAVDKDTPLKLVLHLGGNKEPWDLNVAAHVVSYSSVIYYQSNYSRDDASQRSAYFETIGVMIQKTELAIAVQTDETKLNQLNEILTVLENEFTERVFNGDGRLIREIEYDINGSIRRDIVYDPNGSITSDRQFDANGRLVKETEYYPVWNLDGAGGSVKQVTSYHSNGNISEVIQYSTFGVLINKSVYNTGGQKVIEYHFDDSGKVARTIRNTFASDGTIKATRTYSGTTLINVLAYDANGIKSHEAKYNSAGQRTKLIYYYTNGNIKLELAYLANGTLASRTEYNSGGRRVKLTQYHSNGKVKDVTTYSSNDSVTSKTWYNQLGYKWVSYRYNSQGRVIQIIVYNIYGKPVRVIRR